MEKIKFFLQKIKKRPMFYLFVLVVVFSFPRAIALPSHSFRNAIVAVLGIDKAEENNLEVSVLTLSQSSRTEMTENEKMVTGKGPTMAIALSQVEIHLGRRAQLGHLRYVVMSEELTSEDITPILDSIVRTSRVSNAIPLMICKDKAIDVIKQANILEKSSGIRLSEIVSNNFNDEFSRETSVDSFYNGYYGPTRAATTAYVELVSNEDNGIMSQDEGSSGQSGSESSGGAEQSSGQSGQGSTNKNIISFKKQNMVFKDGKKAMLLSEDETRGVNWVTKESVRNFFKVNGINNQFLENASITFEVVDKKVKAVSKLTENIPKIVYKIDVTFRVVEIHQDNMSQISNTQILLDENLKIRIENEIKNEFKTALESLRKNNTDIIGAYEILHTQQTSAFRKFIGDVGGVDNMLEHVIFGLEIDPKLIE